MEIKREMEISSIEEMCDLMCGPVESDDEPEETENGIVQQENPML